MARRPPLLVRPRLALARPLEIGWRALLDEVARARRWPTSADGGRLSALVAELSAAYNLDGVAAATLLPARLAFSFPRDVPKSAAAAAELVGAGLLALSPARPLDVLDLGAGLGASTWGIVRALAAAGMSGEVRAELVDHDPIALAVAREIARAAPSADVSLAVSTTVRPLGAVLAPRRFDLVLVGQVLSEHAREKPDEARAEIHAALLLRLLHEHVAESGALIVVEPALRERARHLHRVRDRLAAAGALPFAPCLHRAPCPMLEDERDWCHEDLAIDLPPWLAPIARAAGLRFEGLTFSYLVLRRDGRSLGDGLVAPQRLVAAARVTKGKRELLLCGDGGASWATRLDRDTSPANERFAAAERGDVVVFDPAGTPRITPDTRVSIVGARG